MSESVVIAIWGRVPGPERNGVHVFMPSRTAKMKWGSRGGS